MWEPQADLHPSRRAAFAPLLGAEDWSNPRARTHLSRHLLTTTAVAQPANWDCSAEAFRLALLPHAPLFRLARLCGLALAASAPTRDAEETRFVTERATLYWHGPQLDIQENGALELAGWEALRKAVSGQPEAIRQRFEWKTPEQPGTRLPAGLSSQSFVALARRILKEFEEPWPSLFVIPAH